MRSAELANAIESHGRDRLSMEQSECISVRQLSNPGVDMDALVHHSDRGCTATSLVRLSPSASL